MPETSTVRRITVLAGVAMLLAWLVLVFVVQAPTGVVHLLYAAAVVLFARWVLTGAAPTPS